MSRNPITLGFAGLLVVALAASGCGGGGGASSAQAEKEADASLVNYALARELATADAYARALRCGLSQLCGDNPQRSGVGGLLRLFRAQAQEHADALTKALRGLGAPVDEEKVAAEREALDLGGVKAPRDYLVFAYERESEGVARSLTEISKLSTPWPRALLGSIAADEAQHLTLLRQALGAGPAESVPKAFESGTSPAP
jgi:Ferritin-like domain